MENEKNTQKNILYVQHLDQEKDEFEIDLGRIASLFWERRRLTVKMSFGLAVLFLGISFILPKEYESTAVVQIAKSDDGGSSKTFSALKTMTGGSGATAVDNYIALMKCRTVIEPIVSDMEYKDGFFRTADEKKLRAIENYDKWVEKNLSIENVTGTNLISIKASAESPDRAQKISSAVVENFITLQTDLNQKQQSLLVKFLDERIKVAYKESVEAGKKFAEYQKEHKIYSPSEQAKVAVTRMDAFTNTLADLKTKQQATQAELATASQQLADLNMKSKTYQINDNETVQTMRQQIASKEVALVTLHAKFTNEHPDVQNAERELHELQNKLSQEVNAIISSETASMSPQQAALISKKLNAEVNLNIAQVSEQAVQEKYDAEQKKLGDFPESVREYMDLQQEANMKQTIYTNLVTQAENAKIQEAKDSMDIQIVDPANLPLEDMPVSPKKGRNVAIGFVLGILITLGLAVKKYWQEIKDTKQMVKEN